MNGSNFILYYTPKLLGGAELLFLRLARELGRLGNRVILIDSDSAWFKSNATPDDRFDISGKDFLAQCRKDDIIITTSANLEELAQFAIDCRLVVWSIHPYHFHLILPIAQSFLYRKPELWKSIVKTLAHKTFLARRRVLSLATQKNSLFFMDKSNKIAVSQFFELGLESAGYLPIPVVTAVAPASVLAPLGPEIKLCWVGRLCDFKVPTLLHVLRDTRDFIKKNGISIKFTIVGDGDYRAQVKEIQSELNFAVYMLGEIGNSDLSRVILDQDLIFAMGTSALEAGVNGIPTCSVDATYTRLPSNYMYRWLFETSDFVLGWILTAEDENPPENRNNFEELMAALIKNKNALAAATKEYVLQWHDMASVTKEVLDAAQKATFRTSELEVLRVRDPLRRFSRAIRQAITEFRNIKNKLMRRKSFN